MCGGPNPPANRKVIAQAYGSRKGSALKSRVLNVLLIGGDCFFIGMQPILVYMSKVDGKFLFSPVSVNLLTELCKMVFAVTMLFIQARKQVPGEKSLLSLRVIMKEARANVLLAVPSCLYTINNYLKFIMQLYFKPATVKMLSNLKVLTIAVLLKFIMKRHFSLVQWEALFLLLVGISINQLPCGPNSSDGASISATAWFCTFLSVTIPSTASVYNELALKSQFDTSVHLQNLFMYCYGVCFNIIFIILLSVLQREEGLNLFTGHSRATVLLIANNAMQGILSSFFFKYADTILKKYSSTVATIFTGLASAALFGHQLTITFLLGVSVVLISMHQFFSAVAKPASQPMHDDHDSSDHAEWRGTPSNRPLQKDLSLLNLTAGAVEEVNHVGRSSETHPFLPR